MKTQIIDWKAWEERVQALEKQGISRSDAQGIVDAEDMKTQTKVKHTPGPWRLGKYKTTVLADSRTKSWPDEQTRQRDEVIPYGGDLIAESIFNEANARLIATAPELLEVCQAVLKEMKSFEQLNEEALTLSGLTTSALKDAIAKAEGR